MNALGPMLLGLLLLAGAARGVFLRLCNYDHRRTQYRPNRNPSYMNPDAFDNRLCTDAIWKHGYIDINNRSILACKPTDVDCQRKFVDFKKSGAYVFTWISIDGEDLNGAMNDKRAPFTMVSNSLVNRRVFAVNVARYLKNHKIDGLVIDWEYPTQASRTETMYLELLKALYIATDTSQVGRAMYVAVVTPGNTNQFTNYYVNPVHEYVDFLIVKAFDYHLRSPNFLTHRGSLYPAPEDRRQRAQNVNKTLAAYMAKGVPAEKLVIGLSWKAVVYFIDPGAPNTTGSPGKLQERKTTMSRLWKGMMFDEICILKFRIKPAKFFFDNFHKVPYVVFEDYWISYEDVRSVTDKMNRLLPLGVGGVMIDDVEMDDVKGTMCRNGSFPLLNAVARAVTYGAARSGSGDNRTRWVWNGVAAPVSLLVLGLWRVGYLPLN